MYILTLAEYILWVPDSIARLPGPAAVLASNSGTGPYIEPNHRKALAGLFTAAWQHPCQCLGVGARGLLAESATADQLHRTRCRRRVWSALPSRSRGGACPLRDLPGILTQTMHTGNRSAYARQLSTYLRHSRPSEVLHHFVDHLRAIRMAVGWVQDFCESLF